jgi:hypothetical protein
MEGPLRRDDCMDALQAGQTLQGARDEDDRLRHKLLGGRHNLPLTFVNPDPGKTGYEVIVGWEQ